MADKDPKGTHGGSTGKADQVGKGPQAEKGDAYRPEDMVHSGPTRPGGSSHGRPGSESNKGSDDE